MIAWELKAAKGRPTLEQAAWLNMFGGFARESTIGVGRTRMLDARLVFPWQYDDALHYIFHGYWPIALGEDPAL